MLLLSIGNEPPGRRQFQDFALFTGKLESHFHGDWTKKGGSTCYEEMAHLPSFPVVHIVRKGKNGHIADVLAGSAASRAGLQKGDLVLAVDGRQLTGLTDLDWQQVVDGWGDTEACFDIQRQGQPMQIKFHRYSIAACARNVDIGLDLHYALPDRLIIDNSEKGFPAYLAGARKGDEILAIGSVSVGSTDYEQLLQAICQPVANPLALTIRRKGETLPHQLLVKWK